MIKKILQLFFTLSLGYYVLFTAQVNVIGLNLQPEDVSNMGLVTGSKSNAFFRWDPAVGMQVIGTVTNGSPLSGFSSVSENGSKIAATITNPGNNQNEMAVYDTASQSWTYLGGIGGSSGLSTSSTYNISSDGNTIVGLGWVTGGTAHPAVWSTQSGMTDLGSTVANRNARANSVNQNGTVIGGWQDTDLGMWIGALWKNGLQTLIYDTSGIPSMEITSVSDDGNWAVGSMYDGNAFIWNEASGVTKISHPDVDPNFFTGSATSVNATGNIVVGYYRSFGSPSDQGEGFIWTPSTGRVQLTQFVQSLGINTQGIQFNLPLAISPNGKYIVGKGIQNNTGIGFRIELPNSFLSVNEGINKADHISLFPNPVKDYLYIKGVHDSSDIELFDVSGKKVLEIKEVNYDKINLSGLSPGNYIMKGKFNKTFQSFKIIKE